MVYPTTPEERQTHRQQVMRILEEEARINRTTPQALMGHDRTNWKVAVRDRVMWRARHETDASFPTIAAIFGYTHSAAIAAVKRYEKR